MSFYLGIDIGTSSIKVILLDADQHQHAVISKPLTVSRPAPGWSEQAPIAWWQEVDAALQKWPGSSLKKFQPFGPLACLVRCMGWWH